MAEMDVSKIMMDIPKHFNPELAKGVSATIQCLFSGEQASNWVIDIDDQTCTVEEGLADDPDMTIKAKGEDGVKILMGEMDPMRAYMLGKVKVLGDLSLGMKLAKLFSA